MTIEAAFIVVLSVAVFATFCIAIYCSQEVRRLQKQDVEQVTMIANLSAYVKVLADQDVKILRKIEESSQEFIRRDEAN